MINSLESDLWVKFIDDRIYYMLKDFVDADYYRELTLKYLNSNVITGVNHFDTTTSCVFECVKELYGDSY